MEVTYLPDGETPAFPSARRQRQMESVMREFDRWYGVKSQREHLSIEDKAFAFRVKRLVDGS
jgi:hypothetical protein